VGLPHEKTFHYIEPGKRTLNGFETLWFARSRVAADDYSRMARQKCVMNAMLQQISPEVALRNFENIAKASSQMISTSVPGSEVARFLDLAVKAKSQKIATLSLVPPMINTADPDIDLIRTKVAEAIDRAEGQAPAPAPAPDPEIGTATAAPGGEQKATTPPPPTPVTGGSIGSLSTGYAANQAEDLGSAC
jgi:hypothetical protein